MNEILKTVLMIFGLGSFHITFLYYMIFVAISIATESGTFEWFSYALLSLVLAFVVCVIVVLNALVHHYFFVGGEGSLLKILIFLILFLPCFYFVGFLYMGVPEVLTLVEGF